jgi:tRNA modification GTPase
MREKILYHTAYIESALDDPENYSLESYPQILEDDVDNLLKNVSRLLKTCENGRLIQEGIRTAIIGRPNAGKSSVLNMMLGEERAIVTDIEGTTRDTLEEAVNINGILLKLIDTAGIRNTVDIVEKIGVDKARENIQSADLVLYIVDGSQDLNENDESIIQELTGKKVITLLNKSDLETRINRQQLEELLLAGIYGWSQGQEKQPLHILDISAREGTGKDALYDMLSEMFFGGDISYNDEMYITNARHKEALFAARDSLLQVKESIAMGVGEDFYTIDLLAAYESLGLIIGEALEDDLADKIFREFCMGK